MEETGQIYLFESEAVTFHTKSVLKVTYDRLFNNYCNFWKDNLVLYPKLRTYSTYKTRFCTDNYVTCFLSRSERSFIAQFRAGILPLHVETGRFSSPITPLDQRICHFCNSNEVEDERHFLLRCTAYENERRTLFSKCQSVENFNNANDIEKFNILLCNKSVIRSLALFISICFRKRTSMKFVLD